LTLKVEYGDKRGFDIQDYREGIEKHPWGLRINMD